MPSNAIGFDTEFLIDSEICVTTVRKSARFIDGTERGTKGSKTPPDFLASSSTKARHLFRFSSVNANEQSRMTCHHLLEMPAWP